MSAKRVLCHFINQLPSYLTSGTVATTGAHCCHVSLCPMLMSQSSSSNCRHTSQAELTLQQNNTAVMWHAQSWHQLRAMLRTYNGRIPDTITDKPWTYNSGSSSSRHILRLPYTLTGPQPQRGRCIVNRNTGSQPQRGRCIVNRNTGSQPEGQIIVNRKTGSLPERGRGSQPEEQMYCESQDWITARGADACEAQYRITATRADVLWIAVQDHSPRGTDVLWIAIQDHSHTRADVLWIALQDHSHRRRCIVMPNTGSQQERQMHCVS